MTRAEWIEAFARRLATLADYPPEVAERFATDAVDGHGAEGCDQNLHRDPEDVADELAAKRETS